MVQYCAYVGKQRFASRVIMSCTDRRTVCVSLPGGGVDGGNAKERNSHTNKISV